jgi:hypothetical protein
MKIHGPPLRVVWSLLWRSVVLMPLATVYMAIICAAYSAVFVLPIAVGFYLWLADWWLAVGCAAGWVPAFLFLRWTLRRCRSETKSPEGVLI